MQEFMKQRKVIQEMEQMADNKNEKEEKEKELKEEKNSNPTLSDLIKNFLAIIGNLANVNNERKEENLILGKKSLSAD